MASLLKVVLECLTGQLGDENADSMEGKTNSAIMDGKAKRTSQEVAAGVLDAMFSAEKKGRELENTLDDIVRETGWTENIATAVLNGLEAALKKGIPMGQAMTEAFSKATSAALEFAKEHPVYCTIIALGILVMLAPWAVEALGFGELGPIEGMLHS
jgi:hypothetical protein